MDLTKLAGSLLNADSIGGLSSLTGASGNDVTKVLTQALPSLLSGAKDQAKDGNTSQRFATALSDHAKDDTSDVSKFLGKVDMKDGSKIIAHLLGSGKDDVVQDIAKETGVSKAKTNDILSGVAPLLMSLLGQQAAEGEEKEDGVGGLLGSLLDNVDVGSLLTGLLTDNTTSNDSNGKKKKKKKADAQESSGLLGLLGNLLK